MVNYFLGMTFSYIPIYKLQFTLVVRVEDYNSAHYNCRFGTNNFKKCISRERFKTHTPRLGRNSFLNTIRIYQHQ